MGEITYTPDLNKQDYLLLNAKDISASPRKMVWSQEDLTASLGLTDDVVLQLGQEILVLIKNQTGSQIANGTPLMFGSAIGASGNITAIKAIADGTYKSSYILGVATEDIANGEDGFATYLGKVRGLNTTGSLYGETWHDGDKIYVSRTTAGYLTNVEPTGIEQHIFIGIITHVHATQGTMIVRPTWDFLTEAELTKVNNLPDNTIDELAGKQDLPIEYLPSAITFGNTTQEYDIDGTTWVASTDGTPDVAGHLLADALASIETSNDDSYLAVREGVGADPLTTEFTFESVTSFTTVIFRERYAGSTSHIINIELYNYNTTSWDFISQHSSEEQFDVSSLIVLSPINYISTGQVRLRFRHVNSGVNTHYQLFDYVGLSDGGTGGGSSIPTAIQIPFTAGENITETTVQEAVIELNQYVNSELDAVDAQLATKADKDNWGLPDGGLEFDGVNDYANIGDVGLNNTFELFFSADTTTEQIIDLNGTASITISAGTVTATGFTSPTIYVNGVVGSTITANTLNHIIITTDTAIDCSAVNIAKISTNYGAFNLHLFRTINVVYTASQVLQAYNNGRPDLTGLPTNLVYADTLEYILNPSLTTNADNWYTGVKGNHTSTRITTDDATGSGACMEIVATGAGSAGSNYGGIDAIIKNVDANKYMVVEFFAKSITGDTNLYVQADNGAIPFTITTSWFKYSRVIVKDSIAATLRMWLGGAGTVRIDDVSYKEAGCLLEQKHQSFSSKGIKDLSGNNIHGEVIGAKQLGNPNKPILYDSSVTANVTHTDGYLKTEVITGYRIKNNTANAVTLNVGTTASGTDIINGLVVSASADVTDSLNITLDTDKDIYISSALWNSSDLEITIYKERL